jgi:hypothetical protein
VVGVAVVVVQVALVVLVGVSGPVAFGSSMSVTAAGWPPIPGSECATAFRSSWSAGVRSIPTTWNSTWMADWSRDVVSRDRSPPHSSGPSVKPRSAEPS